jgi:NodT family efflux transporter outer membrane factor (OMF) lipoprotein
MASFNREQLGLAGILKSQGISTGPTTAASTQALIGALEQPVNIYQLGFDASWELDLFGRVRRSVEAAKAQSVEAAEARNDLLVSTEAEVAQTYFQLRAAQVLRAITQNLIADQRSVVELTINRHQFGLAGEADVESARAQLSSLQSQLPPYEETLAASRHALAVLTGQAPEALDAEFAGSGELPPLPAVVPVGVPAQLARRRPDIRDAEAALHAATAEVGVSVASLFPDVALSGTFGLRNLGTRYLFDWASHFYTAGGTVSIPIFRGGALVSSVRLSRAAAAEAALNYRKTVLVALQEVEDGLANLENDSLRSAALRDTVDADQRALDVQLDAYRHGLVTYITVLTQQLQTVQARQQFAESTSTQATDLVKLYKALGGGWESP